MVMKPLIVSEHLTLAKLHNQFLIYNLSNILCVHESQSFTVRIAEVKGLSTNLTSY